MFLIVQRVLKDFNPFDKRNESARCGHKKMSSGQTIVSYHCRQSNVLINLSPDHGLKLPISIRSNKNVIKPIWLRKNTQEGRWHGEARKFMHLGILFNHISAVLMCDDALAVYLLGTAGCLYRGDVRLSMASIRSSGIDGAATLLHQHAFGISGGCSFLAKMYDRSRTTHILWDAMYPQKVWRWISWRTPLPVFVSSCW